MRNNSEKVVLITGASRGIGAAIAKKFAETGYQVAINYHKNKPAAEAVCDAIKKNGGVAQIFSADISQSDEVHSLFSNIKKTWGPIDILINNAGITRDNLLMMMSESEWDAVNDINLKACFLTSRAAIKDMMRQRFGRILNIASTSAFVGVPGQVNYCASKGGLIAMTKSLAKELARYGITINAIAPGYIDTEMSQVLSEKQHNEQLLERIPMARPGKANEVANLAEFLVSDMNTYMTGQVIVIDGGLSI